jgi:hypothetical protein
LNAIAQISDLFRNQYLGITSCQTRNSPLSFCLTFYSGLMPSTVKRSTDPSSAWGELTLTRQPDPSQLDNIKAQLDLVLLALEVLTQISSEAMLQAATELNLSDLVADRVALWRLRQSSPLRRGQGRKRMDVEEARALVLIIHHLAKQHQELIRRAVALLEQLTEQNRAPHEAALLGDYIDNFSNAYEERMEADPPPASARLSQLALKLLIDLLFYSAPTGSRRLWMALLDRSLS